MGDQQALEDLRSKIIASMGAEGSDGDSTKRIAPPGGASGGETKRQRTVELPRGPRQARGDSRHYAPPRRAGDQETFNRRENRGGYRVDQRNSIHEGRSLPRGPATKQNTRSRYHAGVDLTASSSGAPSTRFGYDYLKDVIPIDKRKRMSPTKWDITPKGFEKVPAERAKISGLFPQPGQPQELDRLKLERVAIHGGSKSRRTRILFEDATSNNLVISRLSCKLLVNHLEDDKTVKSLQEYLEKFVKGLGDENQVVNFTASSEGSNYVVVEFSSAECTTIVLSCRSFINQKVGSSTARWQRPNEFVQQLDHSDRLCSADIIAIEDLKDDDETVIEKLLLSFGAKTCYINPIYYTNASEEIKEFTGCALVELDEQNDEALEKLEALIWFKPNKGRLVQSSSLITFQSIPKLVTEKARSESKVLVLLNCVDPLDLKFLPFAEEIEQTLKYTLDEVETVRMKRPNVDYRLNFENIGEGIGNIYVKFKNIQASINAMKCLAGSQFNGRTILCAYINEQDFDTSGVL